MKCFVPEAWSFLLSIAESSVRTERVGAGWKKADATVSQWERRMKRKDQVEALRESISMNGPV